jgi:hypothetical protein
LGDIADPNWYQPGTVVSFPSTSHTAPNPAGLLDHECPASQVCE